MKTCQSTIGGVCTPKARCSLHHGHHDQHFGLDEHNKERRWSDPAKPKPKAVNPQPPKLRPKRKHTQGNRYIGRVGAIEIVETGRTKREAVKRLRSAFARVGIQTHDQGSDKLEVVPAILSAS